MKLAKLLCAGLVALGGSLMPMAAGEMASCQAAGLVESALGQYHLALPTDKYSGKQVAKFRQDFRAAAQEAIQKEEKGSTEDKELRVLLTKSMFEVVIDAVDGMDEADLARLLDMNYDTHKDLQAVFRLYDELVVTPWQETVEGDDFREAAVQYVMEKGAAADISKLPKNDRDLLQKAWVNEYMLTKSVEILGSNSHQHHGELVEALKKDLRRAAR